MGISQLEMTEIRNHKDLRIWQQGISLVEEIYKVTHLFPADEKFGLVSQMRRSSVSIPSNIAEGYGRRSTGDYKRFLNISLGSIYELETQIIVAGNLGFIDSENKNALLQEIEVLGKMTNKLISTLNN